VTKSLANEGDVSDRMADHRRKRAFCESTDTRTWRPACVLLAKTAGFDVAKTAGFDVAVWRGVRAELNREHPARMVRWTVGRWSIKRERYAEDQGVRYRRTVVFGRAVL
jgi:hypothetical protein